jgi:hypothetical protein
MIVAPAEPSTIWAVFLWKVISRLPGQFFVCVAINENNLEGQRLKRCAIVLANLDPLGGFSLDC